MSEVATVGKLKCTDTTFVACLNHLLSHFGILVIEHRHHASLTDFGHNGQFIEFCHIYFQFSVSSFQLPVILLPVFSFQ